MRKHLLTALFIAFLAATATDVLAQSMRPERTFYVTPRIGITKYIGDNDASPLKFNDWGGDEIPLAGDIDFGYQYSTRFSIGGFYSIGNYPSINAAGNSNDVARHTAGLMMRWTGMASEVRVAPFLEIGFNGTTMGNDIAFGPSAGLGIDVAMNDRTSLIVGWTTHVTTADNAVDFTAGNGFSDDIDLLNRLNVGVKFNFRGAQ